MVAVELDRRLVDLLRETVPSPTVEVIQGDALQANLPSLFQGRPYRVVANLPYNVATPLIRRLLYAPPAARPVLVLMVQREVGRRLASPPETWTASRWRHGWWRTWSCCSRSDRRPSSRPPEVSSAVVRMRPLPAPRPHPPHRSGASSRPSKPASAPRKQLHNALGDLGVGTERIGGPSKKRASRPARRAETLTLEEWSRLARALWEGE